MSIHHHNHEHHGHGHHHGHHHHIDPSTMSEQKLWWAVAANGLLTLAQVVGGILSGSLSLVADALHNLSDAASLFIALIAIRIGRKPADANKTFGYKRAETIAALMNLTSLIIIGFYLCYEAILRFINPEPIAGWTVVIIASVALIVDIFTAALTYSQSKNSMNMRAAFLHNLTDAMASIAVIISGALILLYGWVWTDALMTLLIASFVLKQGFTEIPQVIHLLMEGSPVHINRNDITHEMEHIEGVLNTHHIHLWQIDEHRIAMEAHVVINPDYNMDTIKVELKKMLQNKFHIDHSTLEFEYEPCEYPAHS